MRDAIKRIEEYIIENSLINKGDRILLSLSAGKDSMLMLHALYKLSALTGFEIGAFHLNHMMRGDESDADENFVRDAAARKNIPFYLERYDFSADQDSRDSFEERAREVRYRLIKECSERNSYCKVATAHTRSDNEETILMRIFTGTGIYGLCGIKPARDNIIRPILFMGSDEIYDCLRRGGVQWREDSSNSENQYRRNFLRNEIIPKIRERFPGADGSIMRLSKLAMENSDVLERRFFSAIETEPEFEHGIFRFSAAGLNPSEVRAAVEYFSRNRFGQYLNESILNEIGRRFFLERSNLPLYSKENFFVEKRTLKNKSFIFIGHNEALDSGEWEYSLYPDISGEPGTVHLRETGRTLSVFYCSRDTFEKNRLNRDYIFVTQGTGSSHIAIRNRRSGDRIVLEYGEKKIKDLFIEKKLDNKTKNCVPLLVVEGNIAAVMLNLASDSAARISKNFMVTDNTGLILALKSI